MGLIITPQSKIEKYFKSEAISQSYLKGLLGGLDRFLSRETNEKDLFYEEKGNLIIGSAVDIILTGEEGEFEKNYYVSQIDNKPSKVEMSITQMVFTNVIEHCTKKQVKEMDIGELSLYSSYIDEATEEHNWQPGWKTKTKFDKIVKVCSEYFEDLKKAHNRQIISEQERILIQDIVDSFKNNPRTKKYFDRERFRRANDIDVYYQLPIYFKYQRVKCKALIDMVIVFKNPDTKVIEFVQPIDIKTMSGYTYDFINNLRRFRYDIQSAFYTFAVSQHFMLHYKDVRLKPFLFIVESTTDVGKPLIYKVSEELYEIGRYGRLEYKHDSTLLAKQIKGFENLIYEYSYFSRTGWKEEIEVTENDGVLELDWNGIII